MLSRQYIAGFFDGEGNINTINVKGKKQFQIRIYQNGDRGLVILKLIQDELGYGNIYSRKGRKVNHEEAHELAITDKQNIKRFKDEVGIFCIIKKAEFPTDEELIDFRINKEIS